MLRRDWMIALTLLVGKMSRAHEKTNAVHLFQQNQPSSLAGGVICGLHLVGR